MTDTLTRLVADPAATLEIAAVLPDGNYDSAADRRLIRRFVRQFAGALTESAARRLLDQYGWPETADAREDPGRLQLNLGPFRVVLRTRSARGVLEIVWFLGDGRRVWRQVVPLVSEVEFSEGSLWGRAKIMGSWAIVTIAATIVGEGFKDSDPGKSAVDATTAAFNALAHAVEHAGETADAVADGLGYRATVEVEGDRVIVTLRRPDPTRQAKGR